MTGPRLDRPRSGFAVAALVTVAVVAISGTAVAASYVVSTNSQIGPSTVAGHQAVIGVHANLIAGSVNSTDLAPSEAWHPVAANPRAATDPCISQGAIGTFCGGCDPNCSVGAWWYNAGGGFTPAAYYRDPLGAVHLRGLVSVADGFYDAEWEHGGRAIFRLPPGYRPAHELVFTTVDNDAHHSYPVRVDVDSQGWVEVVNDEMPTCVSGLDSRTACGQFLSLDGISLRAGE